MVWHQEMPDWKMAKLTELAEFFVVTHPTQTDSDPLFNTLPDTPFDTFMMSISTGTWRALGILLFLLIAGRIGLGVVRYQNGGHDFGAELANKVMTRPEAAPLSKVKLELGEGVYDRETMSERFDKYKGKIRYKDGDAGSLTVKVTSRDWLYRPENFSFSFRPTDFGSLIAAQIRGKLSQRLLAQGSDARISALGLGRVTRTEYTGQIVLDDDFKHPLGISVTVQSFNDDGLPTLWLYSVE